jgi:hypothetical protein
MLLIVRTHEYSHTLLSKWQTGVRKVSPYKAYLKEIDSVQFKENNSLILPSVIWAPTLTLINTDDTVDVRSYPEEIKLKIWSAIDLNLTFVVYLNLFSFS